MLMYKLLELNLNLHKPTCFLSFHHIFVLFSFFRATQLEKHARYATAKATGLPFVPRSSELTHLCSSVLVFFGPIETQTFAFYRNIATHAERRVHTDGIRRHFFLCGLSPVRVCLVSFTPFLFLFVLFCFLASFLQFGYVTQFRR